MTMHNYDKETVFKAQVREFDRYLDGTYQDLPATVLQALDAYGVQIPITDFVHLSVGEPGCIAYTENTRKLVEDRQTKTRIGRYLGKRFPHLSVPTLAAISALLRVEADPDLQLYFARTREEIKHVYTHGPHSCMAYITAEYCCHPIHPTEVYASPDIAIAYTKRTNSDGTMRVTARTVCNMKTKQYPLIYGDDTMLSCLLQDAGFARNSQALEGCRMLRIDSDGGLVAPYLDSVGSVEDTGGEWLLITRYGDMEACNTNGLLDSGLPYVCDCCGERCEDTFTTYNDGDICEGCADYSYSWSDDVECYVNNDDPEFVYVDGHGLIRDDNLEHYGYVMDYLGDVIPMRDAVQLPNDDWALLDDCVYCHIDDCYALSGDSSIKEYIVDGETRYTLGEPDDDPEYIADDDSGEENATAA